MTTAHLESLSTLARIHGIQSAYHDMSGKRQAATPEALIAVLQALGVAAQNEKEIRRSLAEADARRWREGIEPVIVVWNQTPTAVKVRFPTRQEKFIQGRLRLEDGTERVLKLKAEPEATESARIRGDDYISARLRLPALPYGYHALELSGGDQTRRSLVISAPAKTYSQSGRRDWGIFLPLYAARSRESWGAGNFSDWKQLCTWTGTLGGSIAGTLPLLASFLDNPTCDPSPYSPASRLFWNEFYVDLERVPEFAKCPAAQKLVASAAFQKRLRKFKASKLVNYEAEWQARRSVLEVLAQFFFANRSSRRDAFERFVRERPSVVSYGQFRATCDRTKTSWHNWPARMRRGTLRPEDFDPATASFHQYAQWLAQEQVDDLIAHCRESAVQFYLDLPLGVHPNGYDIWRNQECFALDASVGAPPDMFFTQGQDWGFAPLHPQQVRAEGYRYLIDYLRFQMRHTGMLRIDHVMGLHRLFWIPKGFSARQGVYVRYPAEEWLAILSLESHRHQTLLVGENLGTVPPEVNDDMKRHGLSGMYVLQYEQRSDPETALRLPAVRSVASINTHDLPTFTMHWRGLDIGEHARMGWIAKSEVATKRAHRKQLNAAMVCFLRKQGLLKATASTSNVLQAALAWLGKSSAKAVLVNLEDLLLERLPQNTPGTYKERPNWRRKTKLTLEQIFKDPEVQRTLRELNRQRRRNK